MKKKKSWSFTQIFWKYFCTEQKIFWLVFIIKQLSRLDSKKFGFFHPYFVLHVPTLSSLDLLPCFKVPHFIFPSNPPRTLGLTPYKIISDIFPESTGCGEKTLTLQLYIMFRVVWMPQRHVIRRSNGNFVGFPRIILKIVKKYPKKRNSHFSGKWQIWPTRNWNLTLNFEAILSQYCLKWDCIVRVLIVIHQGNFHIEDVDLRLTNI